ncbi:MAG TPA: PAS domain-containing protein [Chitinophagaceae bacterium]|nr:PAS domain-containing protein [Chitinophagaceae bacterium]
MQTFNTIIPRIKSYRASLTDVFFGVLFIILIFVSSFSYIRIEKLVNATDLVNHTHIVKLKLEQTLSYLKDAETGQRGYLLTKDSSFLQPFHGAFDKAEFTAKEIDSLTQDNLSQHKNVVALNLLISDRYDLLNYIIRLSADSTYSGTSLKPYLNTAKEKMDGIRNLIASMINLEDEDLRKRTQEKDRYAFVTPFSLLTLGFFSLGVLIVSFFRVRNDLQTQERMKAELMIQNETFKQAEESSEQGSYSWNLNTRALTYSDNLYRLLGCKPGEFPPSLEKFLEYVHPDDKNYIRKSVKETFRKKEIKISKFRIISKDGKVKYIKGSGKIISSENEQMAVGTIQDITNDTLLTEHLKLREEQLTQAQIIGKLGSWEHDFYTNTIKWSDECYRLYGYKPGEINVDETSFGNVHPDDLPVLKKAAQSAREKGIPIDIEYRRKDKNGKIRHIYSKGEINRDKEGNIRGLFGVHMDITQLRENQFQLEESEKFNRTILDLVPNMVYIYDIEKHTYVFINKNVLHIIGYSDNEIQEMGTDVMNTLVHPDELQKVLAHHENFRYDESGDVREIEYRLKTKKNEWTYQLSRETVFKRSKNGEVTQIIGVAVDITEIKKANENLKTYNESLTKKNEELERMNAELGSFTYVASHDLQEPLRKIRTFTDLIFEKEVEQLSETAKNYFIRISAAATRMQNLIEALLSYSRTNTIDIIYEPTDLNILIDEVKVNLHDVIEEKNAIIESDTLPVIQIIPLQFHQLFLNIIGNAIKYSKHGIQPHIKISSRIVCGSDINVPGVNQKIKYWKISIADNGIGFEQQYANKIFELFQRLHGKTEFSGTGIGLAICKKIVQNHNGIITATGSPGVGATFNIFIPVMEY